MGRSLLFLHNKCNAALMCAAALLGCVSGCSMSGSFHGAGSNSRQEYRPPRVETTGSLINHAVIAHVDDAEGDTANGKMSGARTVSEQVNGMSGSLGSRQPERY
jgi:hypothetical protein